MQHGMRNTSSPLMNASYEEQLHQQQPQQQDLQQQLHHHLQQHHPYQREQHTKNVHHGINDTIDHHTSLLEGGGTSHHYNNHEDEDERLEDREHFNEQHQYAKQQSFLHSSRKLSLQQSLNVHTRDLHSTSQQGQPNQNLDANYISEEQHGGTTSPSFTRYSLLQFAMQHFRNE